jgi:hypothetical protein
MLFDQPVRGNQARCCLKKAMVRFHARSAAALLERGVELLSQGKRGRTQFSENAVRPQWHYLKALELVAWVEERRDETHGVDAMGPIDGLRTA